MKNFFQWAESSKLDLVNQIKNKGKMPAIDPEEYPDRSREGLEGPFRFQNGKILYYDPKEGKYYDAKTDLFLDPHETNESFQVELIWNREFNWVPFREPLASLDDALKLANQMLNAGDGAEVKDVRVRNLDNNQIIKR